MSTIKVHSGRTDTTTHRAVMDKKQVERLLSQHVAEVVGVQLNSKDVRWQCHVSSRMGMSGSELEAIVTITVDHAVEQHEGEGL